jgi:flagellar biogenesis protein FliO
MRAEAVNERLFGWMAAFRGGIRRVLRRDIFIRSERHIRLCETLSLGPRGFLAIVRVDDQRFLVGGTNQSLALLAELSRFPQAGAEAGGPPPLA